MTINAIAAISRGGGHSAWLGIEREVIG